MSFSLPEGARRVQSFLDSRNYRSPVRLLPDSTATAQEAAQALGVSVNQIGKSIVFGGGGTVLVIVVCGDQRVSADALGVAPSASALKPLKATEVKARTGYAIGGVSPFALPAGVALIVDRRLYDSEECYVAAGHPKAVVRTSGRELVALTGARVLVVAEDVPAAPAL